MCNSTQPPGGIYYGDYLQVPSLLSLQKPRSGEVGQEVHDETLFIIVHQVYELWFKQILHELKSVRALFDGSSIEEGEVAKAVHRLERVNRIQKILNDQLAVMRTMTPMDFLEFRHLLLPASGFQSVQFRRIEIILGVNHGKVPFEESLSPEDREVVNQERAHPSLLSLWTSGCVGPLFFRRRDLTFGGTTAGRWRRCSRERRNSSHHLNPLFLKRKGGYRRWA